MAHLQLIEAVGNCAVIGAVHLFDPSGELDAVDPAAPKRTMAVRSRRNEAQPMARPRADWHRPDPFDGGRVEFVLVTIAVDDCSRHRLDDSAVPGRDGTPCQTVDQRIFKWLKRGDAMRGIGNDRRVIIPARMRH